MILQTTLCLAAAAAIINIWLAVRILQIRVKTKVLHGDDGNPALMRRMRAQSNFLENTPFVLILIAGIELTGRGGTWLAVAGAVYMLGRIAHAFGMDRTSANPLRAVGYMITLLTLAGLSIIAVLLALGRF
jgi:uncharacterized protein